VSVLQMPGRTFEGKVARGSVALLYSSRTLSTEVDIDNRDHLLRPGLFVNVTFEIPRAQPTIVIPAEALIFNQHGLQVAVVCSGARIHMQPVEIARDFGTRVELNDGVQGGETIVLNPPSALEDGSKVETIDQSSEQQTSK
jgi:HlyD family secretion protein